MRILIVEDETTISNFLERGLEAEGYETRVVADGAGGERAALDSPVDLVILDRMLPKRDGLTVLASIRRAKPTLPVIVLTARDAVADRVEGLDSGATDYMTKPFSFEELLARIRARLRESAADTATGIEAAGVKLDLVSRIATRDGHAVHLPERQAQLLAYLMRRSGEVCSSKEILRAVWGYDHDPETNVVQVYIGYLRRKLSTPGAPAPIETVRSAGYRLKVRP